MTKSTTTTEQQVAEDEALAEALGIEQPEVEDEPIDERSFTLADRFVGMNHLVASQRKTTRLSEATLVKTLELALNYHVWSTQRTEQEAMQKAQFAGYPMSGGESESEGLVGPDVNEYIGEAPDEDKVIVVQDFIPAEDTNDED